MAESKQLKKSDLLAIIQEAQAPMTKGQIVDALEEYDFIPSYLDYLLDHFVALNRIEVDEDDKGNATWQARQRKSAAVNNEAYRVVETEDGFDMEVGKISEIDNTDGSWSKTQKAAVKKATSAIFAAYKADTAAVRALLEVAEVEAEAA